jgi:hypothetical protein
MLEEYIKELEGDLLINELNLKDYQLRLPAIKHKWAGRCIRHKLEIINLTKTSESLKKTLIEKIQQNAAVKLSIPAVTAAVENHDDYKNIINQIQEKKLIIELLEKTEKTLNSATYDVKNLVEIMKLETT